MKGNDLKVLRIRQGIRANVLADRLGITGGRLSQIEAAPEADPEWMDRIVKAIADFDFRVEAKPAN